MKKPMRLVREVDSMVEQRRVLLVRLCAALCVKRWRRAAEVAMVPDLQGPAHDRVAPTHESC